MVKQKDFYEQALYRYMAALERGDLDTLGSFFQQAEQDELLAHLIEEVHVMYQTEGDIAFYAQDSQILQQLLQDHQAHTNEAPRMIGASPVPYYGEVMPIPQTRAYAAQSQRSATWASLFKRLKEIGLSKEFVIEHLLPASLIPYLKEKNSSKKTSSFVLEAATTIEHIFGFPEGTLLGSDKLSLDMVGMGATRFKKDSRHDVKDIRSYTAYAYYLATLVLRATDNLPQKPIPTQPEVIYHEILTAYGTLSFATVLQYVWHLGVPVLPLNDVGTFHGACWRVQSRNIIVLKQQTLSDSRWLFDLLHELRHAGQDPDQSEFAAIDSDDGSFEDQVVEEEEIANKFAGDVILNGQAEKLVQQCVQAAQGSVERLKSVVPIVAQREHVAVDALANYLAFRLSRQSINWWSTAATFQTPNNSAYSIARQYLLEHLHLETLNDTERQLLLQAL